MQTVIFGEKRKKAIVPDGWYILRNGQKIGITDKALDHGIKGFSNLDHEDILVDDSKDYDCVIRKLSDYDAYTANLCGRIYGYQSDVLYIINPNGSKEITIEKNGTKTTQYIK